MSERGPQGGGELSEAKLAAARSGDTKAFTALVEHYDRRLRTLAYHLLGDPNQTDDALQDVYVKAFRALPDFAGRSALSTWLSRITYTTCMDHLRRRSRLVLVPDLELQERLPEGPDPTDDLSDRRRVRDVLRRLPPEQRAVVVLVLGCQRRRDGSAPSRVAHSHPPGLDQLPRLRSGRQYRARPSGGDGPEDARGGDNLPGPARPEGEAAQFMAGCTVLTGGYLKGAQARTWLSSAMLPVEHVWGDSMMVPYQGSTLPTCGDRSQVVIYGDLTRQELIDVANSLQVRGDVERPLPAGYGE